MSFQYIHITLQFHFLAEIASHIFQAVFRRNNIWHKARHQELKMRFVLAVSLCSLFSPLSRLWEGGGYTFL